MTDSEASLSYEPAEEPIGKAGFVIYGKNTQGARAIIATYSQGRYDDKKDKYYGLPKGSVELEKGETPFDGALRETKEETGIDLERLLGEAALQKLRAGHDVTGEECKSAPPYDTCGVKIKRVYAQPLDRIYVSNGDKPLRSQMFAIEVEGIESFKALTHGGLKNAHNVDEQGDWSKVEHRVSEIIQHNPAYPKLFPDLIEWLREGKMPQARVWNCNKEAPPPIFTKTPRDLSLFERMELEVMGKATADEKQWSEFWKRCKKLQKDGTPEEKKSVDTLKSHITAIKQQILDMGILSDDGVIKLDEKKRAFHFYQEGADIVAIRDLIPYCMVQIKENDSYYKSFGGGSDLLKDLKRHEQFALSQLGILVQFAEPQDLQIMAMKDMRHRDALATKRGDATPALHKSVLDLITAYLDIRGELSMEIALSLTGSAQTERAPLTAEEIAARASAVAAEQARRASRGKIEIG